MGQSNAISHCGRSQPFSLHQLAYEIISVRYEIVLQRDLSSSLRRILVLAASLSHLAPSLMWNPSLIAGYSNSTFLRVRKLFHQSSKRSACHQNCCQSDLRLTLLTLYSWVWVQAYLSRFCLSFVHHLRPHLTH